MTFHSALAASSLSKTFRIASSSEFITLDPHLGYDWLSYSMLFFLCGNLVSLAPASDGGYFRDIAESIDFSDNGKIIIFKLDPQRYFHNGDNVTADDVVFSFNRVTNPKLNSPGAVFFELVKGFREYQQGFSDHLQGITAIGKYELKIELERPSNSFIYALATNFGCIIPRNEKPVVKIERPVSVGPFKYSGLNKGGGIKFQIVDNNKKIYKIGLSSLFDKIDVTMNTSPEVALAQYSRGDIDMILDGLPWSAVNSYSHILATKKLKSIKNSSVGTTYITMNTQIPPFNDVRIRQAVNYAIDRKRLIKLISGAGTATSQIIPPGITAFYDRERLYEYNPQRARELVKAVNLKQGIHANIYVIDSYLYRTVIKSIISDLQKVGIYITPYFGSHKKVLEVAGRKEPGQMIFSDGLGWLADFPDPANFYYPLLSLNAIKEGGWNWSHYKSVEAEYLANKADALLGNNNKYKRKKAWQKLFIYIEKEAPLAPLYNRYTVNLISPLVLNNVTKNKEVNLSMMDISYFLRKQAIKKDAP